MHRVGLVELITKSNAELVRLGVPADEVTVRRERMTGHIKNMTERWARSIGHWGGVSTQQEIAEVVEVDVASVKNYGKRMRLKTCTKRRARSPAELAVACLVTMPSSARESAPSLGLLPVEVVLYRAAATTLLELRGVDLPQLLRWSCDDLESAWSAERLSIALDADEYVDFRDLDALSAMAAEAEAAVIDSRVWGTARPGAKHSRDECK